MLAGAGSATRPNSGKPEKQNKPHYMQTGWASLNDIGFKGSKTIG